MKYKRFWVKVNMKEGLEVQAPASEETNKAIAFAIRWVAFLMPLGYFINAVRWW